MSKLDSKDNGELNEYVRYKIERKGDIIKIT